MSFLLDSCLLSEFIRHEVDPGVRRWLEKTEDGSRFISVLSLAEIRYGMVRLPSIAKRQKLMDWYANELRPLYDGRVLAFDEKAALAWAELRADFPNASFIDSQIAATALVHGLTLVTRNVKDFRFPGLSVFNPWGK